MAIFSDARDLIQQRNILYLPDFIVNSRGVIGVYVEYVNGIPLAAFERTKISMENNVKMILEKARRESISNRQGSGRPRKGLSLP